MIWWIVSLLVFVGIISLGVFMGKYAANNPPKPGEGTGGTGP